MVITFMNTQQMKWPAQDQANQISDTRGVDDLQGPPFTE